MWYSAQLEHLYTAALGLREASGMMEVLTCATGSAITELGRTGGQNWRKEEDYTTPQLLCDYFPPQLHCVKHHMGNGQSQFVPFSFETQ